MKNLNFTTFYVLPLIIYCIIILYLSSFSSADILEPAEKSISQDILTFKVINPGEDWKGLNSYIKHVIEYFILGFLILRLINKTKYFRFSILVTILFGLSFSIVDELSQSISPGRMLDSIDILSDVFGSSLAVYWHILIGLIKKSDNF